MDRRVPSIRPQTDAVGCRELTNPELATLLLQGKPGELSATQADEVVGDAILNLCPIYTDAYTANSNGAS